MSSFVAHKCETYVVVTDAPVEGATESWPLADEVAALVIEDSTPFEVVDGVLLVDGEPV